MELNIIKQIKQTLYKLRRQKPTRIVVKLPPIKLPKAKPIARNKTTVNIDGKELTLSQVAQKYNLELATVRARYRVGNRGKLLIRPSHRHKPT